MTTTTTHTITNSYGRTSAHRCNYGRCARKATAIVAAAATGTEAPATAERRPVCAMHVRHMTDGYPAGAVEVHPA